LLLEQTREDKRLGDRRIPDEKVPDMEILQEGQDMVRCPTRCVRSAASILVGLAALAGPAWAQMVQTAPSADAPPASPAEKGTAEQMSMGILEGTAKSVDPGAGTLLVSTAPLGILRKTLEVTGDTQITVEGREATLSDIQEGETVRASYETHDSRNVATQIEVMPRQPAEKGGVSR
jgi:hypothetical protein